MEIRGHPWPRDLWGSLKIKESEVDFGDCASDHGGLLLAAALFIFLATAAMARIVPADFRLFAAKGPIQHTAIDKGPGSILFSKGRHLMVLNAFIFLGIGRNKLDAALGILFFPVDYIQYLEAMPLRLFGPFARTLAIELGSGAGMEGSLDEIDVCRYIGGIPCAH